MVYDPNGLFPTICAGTHGYAMGNIIEYFDRGDSKSMNKLIQVGQLEGNHEQSNRIYSEDGICPTIMAGERKSCTGGYVSPKIMINTNKIIREIIPQKVRDGIFDKSNRVYNSSGIEPTLTCVSVENEGCMVEARNMNEPKLVGGVNERKNMALNNNNLIVVGNTVPSKHTAGRIFETDGLSPTVMHRNSKVVQILDNKGIDNMWNNNLEKLNFEMKEIRIFDIFAGIGALHQSLKELGVPVRVTNLSEIDVDATISYAAGHIDNFKDLEFEYPSVEEMRQWLIDRNIGYSFEKNKSSVPRMKVEKLKLAYKANVLLNNLGDISKINYDEIEDFDLMNMSFPCTDLSNAGQQRGMKNEDGTPTRSGLYVYSIKAVRAKKPKYVMIENVKALIQKKFIEDFYSVINELEECGYNCYYPTKEDKKGNKSPTCLNSKDFGIPQNRERIFVIAIRKDIDTKTFEFPVGKDYGIRLKDILEDIVDEKYYLSDEIQKRFKFNGKGDYNRNELNQVGTTGENKTIGQRDRTYGINGISPNLTSTDYKQPKQIVENTNKLVMVNRIRKLTPLECWRLMGFRDEAFYKAQELGVSDSQLYKQAGNSIVVNCLYYIFKNLFKEYLK